VAIHTPGATRCQDAPARRAEGVRGNHFGCVQATAATDSKEPAESGVPPATHLYFLRCLYMPYASNGGGVRGVPRAVLAASAVQIHLWSIASQC